MAIRNLRYDGDEILRKRSKEIERIDRESYLKIVSGINKDKVLKSWDQCGGISPRKRQWVKRRKIEFFGILGLPT